MELDLVGVGALIGAVGILATSIATAWVTIVTAKTAARSAEAAAKNSLEAKAQGQATAQAVDGKMSEVIKLVTEAALARGALTERTAQQDRESAGALALARGVGTVPVVVPPVPPIELLPTTPREVSPEELLAAITKLLRTKP